MKKRLMILLLAAAASVLHGASAQDLRLSTREKQDAAAVLAKFKHRPHAEFDLGDPVQKRYLLRQLALAGYTPQRYPETFRSIQAATSRPGALAAGDGTGPQPFNGIIDIRTDDQQHFTAHALTSIPGTIDQALFVLYLADANGNPIGTVARAQQNGTGTNMSVTATGTLPSPAPSGGQMVRAMGTYFYSQNGQPHSAPLEEDSNNTPLQINNLAPTAIASANLISICLNRQGNLPPCDYACSRGLNCATTPNTGNPPNVIFPVQGNIVFRGNIDPIQFDGNNNPTNAFSSILTAFTATGGACSQGLTTNFFKDPNTTVNGPTLSWSLNPAQFGQACYPATSASTYAFSVYVSVGGVPVYAYINNTGGTPTASTTTIPATQIVIGCLAAGSRVRMADGTERLIETFDGTEHVAADAHGRVLTVAGTMSGEETAAMVRITTAAGETLLLTGGHPVVTQRGIVVAHRLQIGDSVTTVGGSSKLVAITREHTANKVYNLLLGMPNEGPVTRQNTTFFANGILVGDSRMQDFWQSEDARDKRTVIEQIGNLWQRDYQSGSEDTAAALTATQKKGKS